MQGRQGKTLDAGRRAQGFLDAEATAIGSAVSKALRAKLDDSVAKLAQFELQQGSADRSAQGATTAQEKLRQDVYDAFIGPIAEIAKVALTTAPEYQNLTAPALTKRKLGFVTRATEVVNSAEKYQALMIEHGMAPEFVAQFRAALAEVVASRTSRGELATQRSKATAGIRAADKAVRDSIRLVDRQLKPTLKRNPALAGAWATAKKVIRLPVTPLPTGASTTATPPASAATNPASNPTLALVSSDPKAA